MIEKRFVATDFPLVIERIYKPAERLPRSILIELLPALIATLFVKTSLPVMSVTETIASPVSCDVRFTTALLLNGEGAVSYTHLTLPTNREV